MNATLISEDQIKVIKNSVRIIEENKELINTLWKSTFNDDIKILKLEKKNKELIENILLIIKKL